MNSGQDLPCGRGFPIRTSADQRSLASPRGFSQRATSFIAFWRQGIHRTPFIRSIHSAAARTQDQGAPAIPSRTAARLLPRMSNRTAATPRHSHSLRSTTLQAGLSARPSRIASHHILFNCQRSPAPPALRLADNPPGFAGSGSTGRGRCPWLAPWPPRRSGPDRKLVSRHAPSLAWRRSGSNRRPPACKAGALPAELRPRDL